MILPTALSLVLLLASIAWLGWYWTGTIWLVSVAVLCAIFPADA